MIPGMGKDAPARLAPQAESEKVEKSPVQDKTAEPAEKATKRRGCPQGGKAEKGPEPRKSRPAKVDKAALDESPSPGVGSSLTSIFADSGHAKIASMSKLALLAVSCFTHYNYFQKIFLIF